MRIDNMLRTTLAALTSVMLLPAEPYAFDPPAIPVGAWYKSPRTEPDYVRSVALSLKQHNFNTVVGNASFTREMVDIFQQQGIAVITHGDTFLDHPAVIGSVVGDDPAPGKRLLLDVEKLKQQYQKLRDRTDKPLITSVAGDGLGVDNVESPWSFWKGVLPQVRCLRWYGIARGHYGILHKRLYKGYVSFSSVLRMASSGKGPFWIVLPSFGKNGREAEHQNPSAAQIKGMMHLAMAYGAKGILFWALQDHADWRCLVAAESLKPTDDKYAAAAEVAARVRAHGQLIRSLRPAGGDVRCPNSFVEAVGQVNTDERRYLYVVNKNTKEPVSTQLLWWGERPKLTKARDIFNGEDLEISSELDDEGYWRVSLSLAPGEGKLLALRDDSPKSEPEEVAPAVVEEREPKSVPDPPPISDDPVFRKNGPQRARKLLGPWMGRSAKWEAPLFGGRLLIDGKKAYDGGGKLIGAYENEVGALAAWDVTSALGTSLHAGAAFITSGTMDKPRPLAIVLFDLAPRDGKEHTYELHLPMAGGLKVVRRLAANISQKTLEATRGNSNAANKLFMSNYNYFQSYPRGRANYCADSVLRPAGKDRPGWLISRVIEPWGGPIFPAAYQRSERTGEGAGTLVVSGRGRELHLKLFLFVADTPANAEPHIFSVWAGKNELRLGSDVYVKFQKLAYGRTVFAYSGPGLSIGVSERAKSLADEMLKPEGDESDAQD
ncbi:MAG: hypothetical protein QF473_09925 [Planctomycetota bacterium]|jgi:hypothetical protein|nr:hypothetical protein [Planctomycetota bacterium]